MSAIPQPDFSTSKQLVIHMVSQLPDETSLDDISEQVAILAAIQRGERAADAGQLVPHEEVKQRLGSWHTK